MWTRGERNELLTDKEWKSGTDVAIMWRVPGIENSEETLHKFIKRKYNIDNNRWKEMIEIIEE